MIIYWDTLEKNAGDPALIPDYIAGSYFGGVELADRLKTTAKTRVYLSADQENIPNNSWTLLQFDTENYDIGSNFDTGNHKFVCPIDGFYLVAGQCGWRDAGLVADKQYAVAIYKNGDQAHRTAIHAALASELAQQIADVLCCEAGDEIQLFCRHKSGAVTPDVIGGEDRGTFLAIHLLSAD